MFRVGLPRLFLNKKEIDTKTILEIIKEKYSIEISEEVLEYLIMNGFKKELVRND